MAVVALSGRPLLTFYFIIPLLPYRTLRDHFLDYPLGGNLLTILVLAIIVGALIQGKSLPKSKLYGIWLVFGVYLYISMWIGTALGNAPPPLWISDLNFATWKDYMLIPLVFVAAGLVVEDRKAVRTVVYLSAISLLLIDRASLLDSMSHTFSHFDESKRDGGPLGFAGSNGLAAFLAQFALFFWAFVQYIKTRKYKLVGYGLVTITLFATMYTFSRAAYIAVLFGAFLLGVLKDRKLILIIGIFLLTWQTIVPTAVTERITMTQNSNGELEASAQERVDLWTNAKTTIANNPIFGTGFATFQYSHHTDNLKDTHNWYIKVMLETGIIGAVIAIALLLQMLALNYRLFRKAHDPLYQGLGLGLFLTICTSIVLNCFGDRWTYLEISGLLWALIGTAARASQLMETSPATEQTEVRSIAAINPYMSYR